MPDLWAQMGGTNKAGQRRQILPRQPAVPVLQRWRTMNQEEVHKFFADLIAECRAEIAAEERAKKEMPEPGKATKPGSGGKLYDSKKSN